MRRPHLGRLRRAEPHSDAGRAVRQPCAVPAAPHHRALRVLPRTPTARDVVTRGAKTPQTASPGHHRAPPILEVAAHPSTPRPIQPRRRNTTTTTTPWRGLPKCRNSVPSTRAVQPFNARTTRAGTSISPSHTRTVHLIRHHLPGHDLPQPCTSAFAPANWWTCLPGSHPR